MTDRGSQFESRIFDAMTKLIGSNRTRTTAYHPASNGMVERWHRSMKAAIMCHETPDWVSILPTVLLGLSTSYKDDIKASAAELVYGTTLRLPGEFFVEEEPAEDPQLFKEQLREQMRKVRAAPTAHHYRRRPFAHATLYTCTHVFVRVDAVRRPLERPYEGPYEVLERKSDRVFLINIRGSPTTVSTERLKPAFFEIHAQREDTFMFTGSGQPGSKQQSAPAGTQTTAAGPVIKTYPGRRTVRFAAEDNQR